MSSRHTTPRADRFGWVELIERLAALPASARDEACEAYFGIGTADSASPGPELIGYHASGVAPIVRALVECPVRVEDVVVDLGAGLGKVVRLAGLLADARGIELQAALVARANDPRVVQGDARTADLEDGTVFFVYLPFTGTVLDAVCARLERVARHRRIVVCALGMDLRKPWLTPRPTDSFWLTIYDSEVPRPARDLTAAEAVVAFERSPLERRESTGPEPDVRGAKHP